MITEASKRFCRLILYAACLTAVALPFPPAQAAIRGISGEEPVLFYGEAVHTVSVSFPPAGGNIYMDSGNEKVSGNENKSINGEVRVNNEVSLKEKSVVEKGASGNEARGGGEAADESEGEKADATARDIIRTFQESMGFTVPSAGDTELLHLLAALEREKRYGIYFELKRILIKYYLLKGETRLAAAQSEQMYSKAKALDYFPGLALSFNALGEVYALTGRSTEAAELYRNALEIFDSHTDQAEYIKILLAELAEYYIRTGNLAAAGEYIGRLNKYPDSKLSLSERAVIRIFNAYYEVSQGRPERARAHLDAARDQASELAPEIGRHRMIAEAFYLEAVGKDDKALGMYGRLLAIKDIKENHSLYIVAMTARAELLEKMGRKNEAFNQYSRLYSFINTSFERNYPKEIDQLSARFQASRLTYLNEREAYLSMRYYTVGIIICILVLLAFSFLTWKKIYRLKQSRRKSERMKKKAEGAIRKKNLFLSNMSHEVRTPLNAIVGFSALMASAERDADQESGKEYYEIIKTNSYQLLKLIDDIIDISDLDDDNIRFNIRPCDAVKICRQVLGTVEASGESKAELRFETDLPELIIETDDSRLRQVLINLLVNAVKFTPEGFIVLRLEMSGAEPGTALFSVTDTGCGIPPEQQKRIFERFEKVDDLSPGTGLGLSICRIIADHMNGRLWVDANYTCGARFCFAHPLKYKPRLFPEA